MLASTTSKWRLNRVAQAALLRVGTGPEYPEDNQRELMWGKQYVNHELPDVQAGFRKGRGTRDLIANNRWIMEKAREFQKNIYFSFIDYAKAFDGVYHNKLWKILQELGILDHLTSFLQNLCEGQEATIRTN